MEGHDPAVNTETSAFEHWTMNMPDHIINNDKGPTAKWDSPAPPAPKEKPDEAKKADAAAAAADAKAPKA